MLYKNRRKGQIPADPISLSRMGARPVKDIAPHETMRGRPRRRKAIILFALLFLAVAVTHWGDSFCRMEHATAADASQGDQTSRGSLEGGPKSASLPAPMSKSLVPDLTEEERVWLREHPVITVAQDPDWPPIEFVDEDGDNAGITADYLKLIEQRLGVTFERVRNLSWQESYARLKRWEIDMTTSVTTTPERIEFWAFTKPYMNIPIVIFTQTDVTFVADLGELAEKKVAVVDGYAVCDWIPRDYPDIQLVKVKNATEGLDQLQNGRVFAYIDNMLVVSYYLAKLKVTNVKIAGETPYKNAQSMAVRKDWAILAGILQKALDSISPSERDAIYQKWMPIRYEHGFNYTLLWQALAIFTVIILFLLAWNRKLTREITHRKSVEKALGESDMRMRNILDNVGAYVFIKDTQYRYTYVNNKVCDLFGRQEGDILGKADDAFFSSSSVAEINLSDRPVIERGETVEREEDGLSATDRLPRSYWTVKIPLRDNSGQIYGLCGISTDITERKRGEDERRKLEERLLRAEKMEALGTLAGGVAHDLNNVLGIVVGYSELLVDDLEESGTARSKAMEILKGGQKAGAIVQDLLTLARRGLPSRKVLNLNHIVTECRNSFEFASVAAHHPKVRIDMDLEAHLLNMSGSAVHLGKSLANLLLNAAEAMPTGGAITIRTENRYLDRPISGYDEVREGDYVVLSVSDTGEGISPADLKRVFEPFYTKKVMGRSGTGLGLAVVWGTVKDHHGYVNVESREGEGTTFTLYFPVTREEVTPEAVAVSAAQYMGNGQSILVVDDVKEQRELAATMLRKLNYRVSTVSSGEEAVEHLRNHEIDLLILDMIMDPGLDGLDTYTRVLEIRPHQKAIIVSGFSESERVTRAQELGAGAYVRKPYLLERLGLAVKEELQRPARSVPQQKS